MVFAFVMSLIPGMVEDLVTGKVQQSVPGLTPETQPLTCRGSSACCVALLVVKNRYLVPIQKSVGGSASHN